MSSFYRLAVVVASVFALTLTAVVCAQNNVTENPQFAPWSHNSIQPPPGLERGDLPPTAHQPGDTPTQTVCRDAIAWFDGATKRIDDMIPAAEAAADRLIAGGHLWAFGTPGFAAELYGRAGGAACLREWEGEELGPNDVLIVGRFSPLDGVRIGHYSLVGLLAGGGWNIPGEVVHIAGNSWPQVARIIPLKNKRNWGDRLFMLDSGAPEGGSWSDVALGQMSAAATAHAFIGEIFAAVSRKGKTLGTLGSDLEPNGRNWDKSVGEAQLNPKYKIPPIPAGKIARDYYLTCQKQIADFLVSKEVSQLRAAAARLVDANKKGNAVFLVMGGHIHPQGARVPRDCFRWVVLGRSWEWRSQVIRPGDVLLDFGYLDYPRRRVKQTLDAGGTAVTFAACDGPTDDKRIHVNTRWVNWDSCVNVAGLPVRILPSSGVVTTVQWYALVAEVEKGMK